MVLSEFRWVRFAVGVIVAHGARRRVEVEKRRVGTVRRRDQRQNNNKTTVCRTEFARYSSDNNRTEARAWQVAGEGEIGD